MNYIHVGVALFLILGVATYTDLRWRIIPDKLVFVGLVYFLVLRLWYADQPYYSYLLGMIAGTGILYVCALIRPGSFGGGDIKLLAVVGVAIGWQESLLFLCLLLGIAGMFSIIVLLIRKNWTMKIPLAPFFFISQTLLFVMKMGWFESWINI